MQLKRPIVKLNLKGKLKNKELNANVKKELKNKRRKPGERLRKKQSLMSIIDVSMRKRKNLDANIKIGRSRNAIEQNKKRTFKTDSTRNAEKHKKP